MRWPRHKQPDEHVDPHRAHEFRPRTGRGIAALSSLDVVIGRPEANLAIASGSTRTYGCAVPGCGKPPEATVHAPEE